MTSREQSTREKLLDLEPGEARVISGHVVRRSRKHRDLPVIHYTVEELGLIGPIDQIVQRLAA